MDRFKAASSTARALRFTGTGWYQPNPRSLRGPGCDRSLSSLPRVGGITLPGHAAWLHDINIYTTCAVENQDIADHVASLRGQTLQRVRDRLAKGVADGQLLPEDDIKALGRFVGAMIQGMSVQARDGAGEAELLAVAALAIDQLRRHAIPPSSPHR